MIQPARVLIDGCAALAVSVDDRGLLYGDGVFETLRVRDGSAPLWAYHAARLQAACARLRLTPPALDVLWAETLEVTRDLRDAVVKIILTRGVGQRGYAPAEGAPITRIVRAFAPPAPYARDDHGGIAVRWCDWRMGVQPALAGLKHLNRLDQVMARAEWQDARIAEGLVCDLAQRVVGATAGNVFVRVGDMLCTPDLSRCGVAGVCRAAIIAERLAGVDVVVRDILRADIEQADEVFVCNSVRGVLPVSSLDAYRWLAPGPCARAAIAALQARGLRSECAP
jgi:4-amino-4-deoxychorismate lyase